MWSNPVKTDTEEAIESVHINWVSVLSRSCYLRVKNTPVIRTK